MSRTKCRARKNKKPTKSESQQLLTAERQASLPMSDEPTNGLEDGELRSTEDSSIKKHLSRSFLDPDPPQREHTHSDMMRSASNKALREHKASAWVCVPTLPVTIDSILATAPPTRSMVGIIQTPSQLVYSPSMPLDETSTSFQQHEAPLHLTLPAALPSPDYSESISPPSSEPHEAHKRAIGTQQAPAHKEAIAQEDPMTLASKSEPNPLSDEDLIEQSKRYLRGAYEQRSTDCAAALAAAGHAVDFPSLASIVALAKEDMLDTLRKDIDEHFIGLVRKTINESLSARSLHNMQNPITNSLAEEGAPSMDQSPMLAEFQQLEQKFNDLEKCMQQAKQVLQQTMAYLSVHANSIQADHVVTMSGEQKINACPQRRRTDPNVLVEKNRHRDGGQPLQKDNHECDRRANKRQKTGKSM